MQATTYKEDLRKVFGGESHRRGVLSALLTAPGAADVACFWLLHGRPGAAELRALAESGFRENFALKCVATSAALFAVALAGSACSPLTGFAAGAATVLATPALEDRLDRLLRPWEEALLWLACTAAAQLILQAKIDLPRLLRRTATRALRNTLLALADIALREIGAEDMFLEQTGVLLEAGARSAGKALASQTVQEQINSTLKSINDILSNNTSNQNPKMNSKHKRQSLK